MFKKYTGELIILSTLLLLMACAPQQAAIVVENAPLTGETRVYEVFGMDCPGCHGGIEKQINAVDGVMDSRADWTKQEIMIVLDQEHMPTEDELFAAIRKANFTPGKRIK